MKASAINTVYIPLARLGTQGHSVCVYVCAHACGCFLIKVLKLTMQSQCIVCASEHEQNNG